jgi:cyclophilin family peptidyl-prolyl cis-trans isomerase
MRLVRLGVLIGTMAILAAPSARAQKSAPKPSSGAGPVVAIETEKGTFEFETYPNEAPKTVARIVELVRKRFYNGQRFHRVVPGFVVQVGDPTSRDMTKQEGWGTRGSGTPIGAAEFSKLRTHVRGAVVMAHLDDPAKADSQFYITLAPAPRLDGKYTVFGKVISGMNVVSNIAFGDRLVRATVKGEK